MEITLNIKGMMCPHCEATVKKALESFEQVQSAEVSHEKGTAVVRLNREMNADELYDTTMSPEHRSLIKVSITDAALAEKRVSVLMGDKVEPRKEWIDENVVFTLEDNYEIGV